MSMIAPEAEGVASKFGLTGSQKASAGLGAVPTPRTNHPYVVGIALVLLGGFGLIGSITGTLPSMFAALFVPNALVDSNGGDVLGIVIPQGSASQVQAQLNNTINGL